MIDAYIALGSNLGDRLENLSAALTEIANLPATELLAVSHAYESEPWGVEDQPDFANAVARVRTDLEAPQLLTLLQDAEECLGRVPGQRNGPRVIDLDLLLYGDEEWSSEDLTIPHPRMAEREFVLRPLLEVDPDVRWPDGSRVWGEEGRVGRITDDLGAIPGFEELTIGPETSRASATPPGAEPDLSAKDFEHVPPSISFRVPGSGSEAFRDARGQEWVALGVSRLDPSPNVAELIFYEAVLKDAGIPCEFYPTRPGEGFYGPYATPRYVDLYVPEGRVREARDLIRQAREAPNAGE